MKKQTIFATILLILSVLLAVGTLTVFSACRAKDDGSYMSCHWAGMMSCALAVVLAGQSAIALFAAKSGATRRGVFAAMVPTEILLVLTPGAMISLCMMPDMHCRMLLRPFVLVMGVVLIVLTIFGHVTGRGTIDAEKQS